ncbi:hypothetical protein MPH_12707 [Macrophomina phaseolina MS6]|uniref:Uncharacterized protein n=1 Tax=Macrophomina phaseolina (strain MS6) TaxID=1126212 RepID=K2R776_MACPH|nr:hypothetical protein MPH_12707 [Macrophomina phaseolina MS6]
MTHSPQGRCEDEESFSPPPSYTATPSPYTRPQKDAHHFQAQQHQQALEQYHSKQQQRPSSTVLNLISAAAAYKSIITGLDASGNPVETNASTAHQPTAPTTTAITPSSTAPTLHTQAPVPSPSYYAETHHPYPQATHSAHSTPSPPTQQPPYHQLHAPRPLRPLRSVRQLEPPAPAAAPQPQPMHPLTHPTTAPHAHAQLTHMRLAARTTTAYPTILTPHPFIRALAARLVSPELISLYFGDFHYCWPMLHRGRFLERLEEQPVELVWSVGLVGSLFLEQQRQQGGASMGGSTSPWGPGGSPGSVTGSVRTRRDEEETRRSRQQQQRWGERGGGSGNGGGGSRRSSEERDTFRNAAREVHEWLLTNLSAHLNQVLSQIFSSFPYFKRGKGCWQGILLGQETDIAGRNNRVLRGNIC